MAGELSPGPLGGNGKGLAPRRGQVASRRLGLCICKKGLSSSYLWRFGEAGKRIQLPAQNLARCKPWIRGSCYLYHPQMRQAGTCGGP